MRLLLYLAAAVATVSFICALIFLGVLRFAR